MFSKITVDGLRGVKDLTLEDFRRINLIVGKNNSGKSTVLEGLFMLSAPAQQIVIRMNSMRSLYIEETKWNILFHNLNTSYPIRLEGEARVGEVKESRTL